MKHRDSMRKIIQTGGTSFLIGLLFGDVIGAGAVIFATRSMLDASYSRDAERRRTRLRSRSCTSSAARRSPWASFCSA